MEDVTTQSVPDTSPAPESTAPAEPSIIDLSDENSLIKIKGSEKPVKFGDHVRGFQAQFTKASQKAAQLERALAEREERLRQLEAAQRSAPSGQQDVYEALRALPYLSGEDAVQVVQSIGEQLKQRDMVLLAALKQMQALQNVVKGLNESSTTAQFDAKISRWLEEGGYPPEAKDLAKEIYLAYEGDDLDQEFPAIFHARWTQIENAIEARRAQKVAAARKQPFVPGRGGQAGPSKPLAIPANASAKEVSNLLWDSLQTGSGT